MEPRLPVSSSSDPLTPPPSLATSSVPPLARLHVWQIQAVRDLLLVAAVIGLVWAGYAMRSVTVPLLIALVLAYLFEPLVQHWTRSSHSSRPMVVGSLLGTLGLLFVLLLALLIPLIITQTIQFVDSARSGRFERQTRQAVQYVPEDYRDDVLELLDKLSPERHARRPPATLVPAATVPATAPDTQPAIDEFLPAALTDDPLVDAFDEERVRAIVRSEIGARDLSDEPSSTDRLMSLARGGGRTVFNILGAVLQLGLLVFLIPFYFYFFSVWFPEVQRFSLGLIPRAKRATWLMLIGKMDRAVAGFVRGRIVIALIVGVMLAIGWFVCGVPYSIPLGMLIGAFSMVPYLGGIGLPVAIGLLALGQLDLPAPERMGWLWIILWPTIVFAIVQVIESYVLTPMIAGKATNLDPVTILVAVLAGGSVGGVYGMIISIPVAACLKILITDVLLPRIRAWSKGEAEDPLPLG